ncbi:MAG: insulinase family protein [Spirochaetaceae bacterium]|nr:insulinase family protein [Spirochaetaceae bacterium]
MIFTRPGLRGALLAALALCSLIVTPTPAQPRIPGAPIPFDPTVRRGTLDNGVQYYIRRNAEPAARAQLWLAVRAGAVLEEDDQRGLARFVARMALRGTERYSAQEIAEYLASVGGSPVPDEHVQTGFDATVFHFDVPAGAPEALQAGIEMLSEWAFAISFPPDATQQERELMLADWDTAADVDLQLSALFGDSRYAERRPGGRREVIESAGPEQLAAFYERWYRPDRMALIAVGDFDPEVVESTVRGHLSQPAQGAGENTPARRRGRTGRSAFAIPDHDEPRVSVITDPEAGAAYLTLSRKLLADTSPDVTAYRDRLLQRLVDAMINARLAEPRLAGRAYLSAGVGRSRLTPDVDLSIATAQVERGGVERALQALLEELRRVQVHGFTEAEVERNKTALTRSVQDAYEARDQRPSHLLAEEYMRHFLEGGSYPGIERERELHRLLLPEISSEDLHAWAAGTLPTGSAANTVLLVTAPPAGAEGAADEGKVDAATWETRLREQLIAAAALEVEPYRGSPVDGSPVDDSEVDDSPVGSPVDGSAGKLLAVEPPRGSIVAERQVLEIGARHWTLSNGIVVIARPITGAGDEVLFHATSPGGTSLVSDADFVPALTAATVVAGSGAGPHDGAALQELLAGKRVTVTPYIAELFEGFSGGAAAQDLETLFQLIYLYATRPRVDDRVYAQYEAQLGAMARQREARPDARFSDTLRIALSQGHFRARPATVELLEELDLERSVRVYADRFADFSDFTFLFVGAFDWQVLRDLAESYLAALPAGTREERWQDVGIDPPPGIEERTIRGGAAGRSTTRLVFAGGIQWTRHEALTLATLGEVLERRLRERLPDQVAGASGIGVGSDSQLIPDPEYRLIVGFDSDPARADDARDAVLAEIAWLRRGGERQYLEEALAEAKEALRADREERLVHNRFWLEQMLGAVRNNEPLAEVARFPERLDALDADHLVNAARRYLTPDRYVRVVMLPE